MSADDLWLIRTIDGRLWPIHAFASPIVEGEPLPLPGADDPSFTNFTDALEYTEQQPDTEYGAVLDTERGLQTLKMLKMRDQQDIRAAMTVFVDRMQLAMLKAEADTIPMPGNLLVGTRTDEEGSPVTGTVIASSYYREAGDNTIPEELRDDLHDVDIYTILLLNDEPPYYTVGNGYWRDGVWVWTEEVYDHMNINPAVNGEQYLGNESNRTGKSGYSDLGGSY